MSGLNSTRLLVVSAILLVISNYLLVEAQQPVANQVGVPTAANLTCVSSSKPTAVMAKYNFQSCIVVQFAAYLKIGDDKYVEFKNGKVDTNASNCQNTTVNPEVNPKIVVQFDCGSVAFDIAHNSSKTYVSAISGKYTDLSNSNVSFSDSTVRFETSSSGHYYKCNAEQAINFNGNISLILSQVAIEAYRDANGTDFYQIQEECPLDSQPVSDLVRIGVGVCLVALVAIVLVAYFVGRRRWSERSSYESV